jgi:hypothetical protein
MDIGNILVPHQFYPTSENLVDVEGGTASHCWVEEQPDTTCNETSLGEGGSMPLRSFLRPLRSNYPLNYWPTQC